METLKRKWNSRRGATILLALLFLLICMMAGASIVMAAASNGGKAQSNKTEQQKYLTVASAMNMLVDELKSVKYTGNYSYERQVITVVDEAGIVLGDYSIHTYTQNPGTLDCKWLDKGASSVLPLRDYLDYIFAENFVKPAGALPNDEYIFNSRKTTGGLSNPGSSYTLTFKAPSGYGDLGAQVTIEVELRADGSILLKATLAGGDYTMMALLKPSAQPEEVLVLDGSVGGLTGPVSVPGCETEPISWELEYIFKQEATASETPTTP